MKDDKYFKKRYKVGKNLSSLISHFSFQKGFTLIELLVAIVIIGILSAFLTVNFVGVRERARDSQRKSDLHQIQVALELYRADHHIYPFNAVWFLTPNSPAMSPSLSPYMSEIPVDPLWRWCYSVADIYKSTYLYYSSDGTRYTLYAVLENDNDSEGKTHVKSPPNEAKTNISSDNKTITLTDAGPAGCSCCGKVYNYWINSP